MVSDPIAATNQEQATLPFGTEITAETQATTNQRFTSYDRSGATGLDYAVNRTYNSGQGRFTTVDPIGMQATQLSDPQSLNLFAYTQNNPVDLTDPSGLLLGILSAIGRAVKSAFSSVGGAFSSFASWAWGGIERSARFIGRVATRVVSFVTRPIRSLLGFRRIEGGSGSGSGEGQGEQESTQDKINNCLNAIEDRLTKDVRKKVESLYKDPPIFDLDGFLGIPNAANFLSGTIGIGSTSEFTLANMPAVNFLGANNAPGETVGAVFDRRGADAVTYRGLGRVQGIYYRSSRRNLLTSPLLLLHELTHLAYPSSISSHNSFDLDKVLIDGLGLTQRKGENSSDTVSRFFNAGCPNSQQFGNDDKEFKN